MTHALIRTSLKGPGGGEFIGKCIKCGREGLGAEVIFEDCPADDLVSDEQALLDILDDDTGEDMT